MKAKLTIILATLLLGLSFMTKQAQAEENQTCQYIYGGQVCASSTPEIVDTAGESELLFTLSGVLYATGLTSFVVAKNADKFVPKI